MSRFCITGGAGFIGSHFVSYLHKLGKGHLKLPVEAIVIYDKLTYAADLNRLKDIDAIFVEGDVCNANHFTQVLKAYDITHILHFAAETHVDRSLNDDMPFVQTNILGTLSVLEAAAHVWSASPSGYDGKLLVHISTDEVYGPALEYEKPCDEKTVLKPSNPYSATKAAADQLVISKMLGENFPALIIRSSNNFGAHQHPEKLIPKVFECLKKNTPIPVYGEGMQRRCWISAKTLCEIIGILIESDSAGQIFNIRGKETLTNLELVHKIRSAFLEQHSIEDSEYAPIAFVPDRRGHDFYYNIDDSKVKGIVQDFVSFEALESFIQEELVKK
ncbi:MAG TPA: dTDP-glucose 4,6-dehydratase [Clostridiales bacterium UBA8960]|nr:dTDP-glucose 4,6-dehydratase [Clostridiales bacterium UBA8960]